MNRPKRIKELAILEDSTLPTVHNNVHYEYSMSAEQRVERFINYLQEQIKEKKLSKYKFAELMDVSRRVVYNWLEHKQVMSLTMYYRALDVLGVTEEFILKQIQDEKDSLNK